MLHRSGSQKGAGEICQCQTHIGIGNTKMTPVCQLVKKWRFSLETLVFLQFSGTDLVFEVKFKAEYNEIKLNFHMHI